MEVGHAEPACLLQVQDWRQVAGAQVQLVREVVRLGGRVARHGSVDRG
jgi:hypothetical protein